MSTGLGCVSEKLKLWNADGLWDSLNIFRYLIWVILLLCPKRVQCIPFSTHFHEHYAFFQIWSALAMVWTLFGSKICFVQSPVFEDLESWGRRCWDAPLHPFTAGNQLHLQIIYPAVSIWMYTGIAGVYPMAKLRIICVALWKSKCRVFQRKEVLIPSILAMLEYYHWDFIQPTSGMQECGCHRCNRTFSEVHTHFTHFLKFHLPLQVLLFGFSTCFLSKIFESS